MKFKSLVLIFSLCFFSTVFASGFMEVANVSRIQGTAYINKSKIKVGDEVAEGMHISIPNKKDFIEVKFQNGHIVRFMGANVKVQTLNPKNTLFNLLKGKIFSLIKPLTAAETFQVKTRSASFAVRGTKFYIDETKKNSYLCVCEGSVVVKAGKNSIEVLKDQDLKVASSKAKLKVRPAGKMMIDIGNAIFKDMSPL